MHLGRDKQESTAVAQVDAVAGETRDPTPDASDKLAVSAGGHARRVARLFQRGRARALEKALLVDAAATPPNFAQSALTPRRYFSVLGILLSNVLALATAIWQEWTLAQLLWPYWLQTVVIGAYSRKRLLALPRFSTEGVEINDVAVEADERVQCLIANFFTLNYSVFLLIILFFLIGGAYFGTLQVGRPGNDLPLMAALGAAFWISHHASHRINLSADMRGLRNIGAVALLPYARVTPMFLVATFGAFYGGGLFMLLVFVWLKTLADILMHNVEHTWLQGTGGSSQFTFHFVSRSGESSVGIGFRKPDAR